MNILFVTANRIGDAVLSTGLLDHLVRSHPGARVTLACGPAAAPLFAAAPGVERCIAVAKRRASLHWLMLWRACVAGARLWDLIVDLRGSGLAYFLPARRRRVYRSGGGDRHRLYALAAVLGLAEPPPPRLWTTPEAAAEAARLIPADGPVLALGPTANWRGKVWPGANFAALAGRLTAPGGILPGARVAVLGAPGERGMARPVLDALPGDRRIDLVGAVDLAGAAAALGRCALFVGNDSGLMHVAAAAGVPTLGLFGPSRPEHYAPWGAHTAVARTAVPYERLFPPGYDPRTTGSLMDSLSVGTAAAAAESLWRRAGDSRR